MGPPGIALSLPPELEDQQVAVLRTPEALAVAVLGQLSPGPLFGSAAGARPEGSPGSEKQDQLPQLTGAHGQTLARGVRIPPVSFSPV